MRFKAGPATGAETPDRESGFNFELAGTLKPKISIGCLLA